MIVFIYKEYNLEDFTDSFKEDEIPQDVQFDDIIIK